MAGRSAFACAFLLASAGAGALCAQVEVQVLPDGSKLMHNRRAVTVSPPPERPAGYRSVASLREMADRYAEAWRLDPRLVDAVIQAESGYDPRARSSKGAMGLMQLMPDTARELSVIDPWDPGENLRAGTRYLRRMLDRFGGRLELALAAYNAGPEAVRRHSGVPPYRETREYVRRVLALYHGDPSYRLAPAGDDRGGRPTYIVRDARGRLIMTTRRPGDR